MHIVVAGGTGFVGRHLIQSLLDQGHKITIISRHRASHGEHNVHYIHWEQLKQDRIKDMHVDAIVNLAGETINQRWSEAAKQRILQSRITTTRAVADWVSKMEHKPNVVVQGSGISVYGSSLVETFDETSNSEGHDFLAEVVKQWEHETKAMEQHTRVVRLRLGIVLSNDGGAFPKLMLPFRFGVGGKIGKGNQWFSWIHIQDCVNMINKCLDDENVQGAVNATSPEPVTNADLTYILAKVLHRPHFFTVPSFALKLLLGEMSTLMVDGQRVIPQKMLDHRFEFLYPTFQQAATQIIQK